MWRPGRRRTVTADAIVELVHEAVVHMRAMAYRGTSMCDDTFPGADYHEQIRLLADLCDTLVPGLRPGRRRRPGHALQYTWDSRNDEQRQWITRCLAARGVDITELIETRRPSGRADTTTASRGG